MKKFSRSIYGTFAATAFTAAAFASPGQADSVVTVNADGSVTNMEAPQGVASRGQVAPARPGQPAGQVQADLSFQEIEASALLEGSTAPSPDAKGNATRRFEAEESDDPSLLAVKRDLAKYPRGQVKIVNGKTLWIAPGGDVTVIGDNNKIIIAPRPGYRPRPGYYGGYYGYRPPYYGFYNYSTMIFSAFSPGYVFYTSGIPGYLYKVPVGNGQIIGGHPVYGYPGYGYGYPGYDYGYPAYGYPDYGYPGYGYPGYHSYTTTFGGPGSITSTYKSKTSGTGIGVSIGKGGFGVSLGGGSTKTNSKTTIEADMAPGTTITTTKTYPVYGYPGYGHQGLGAAPFSFNSPPMNAQPFGYKNNVNGKTASGSQFGTMGTIGTLPKPLGMTPPPSPAMIRPRIR